MRRNPTIDKLPLSRAERHPEKAHRPDNPIRRKPDWIRVQAPNSPEYAETKRLMRQYGLTTVCEEAACPNIGECWKQKHATFMIMGDTCTRACAFCNVATGKPGALNPHEPANIAEAVGKLGLGHVVVTSVDRDDLDDGGAGHFAAGDHGACTSGARHDDRGADARLHAQGRARSRPWSPRGPTCSTTISRPCRGSIRRSGPARATSPRCVCCRR